MTRRQTASGTAPAPPSPTFVVQKHWTQSPHYDLHLEVEGRLVCWMLPKVPVHDPHVRRFALRTPDRELDFGHFEGVIPEGEPGAGVVMVWDLGSYEPYPPAGMSAHQWLDRGLLKLHFHGEKLRGLWQLVRWHTDLGTPETWVLVKLRDRHAKSGEDLDDDARSALTGRDLERIVADSGPPTPPPRAAPSLLPGALGGLARPANLRLLRGEPAARS